MVALCLLMTIVAAADMVFIYVAFMNTINGRPIDQ